MFLLLEVHQTSRIAKLIVFMKIGKMLTIISSNIFIFTSQCPHFWNSSYMNVRSLDSAPQPRNALFIVFSSLFFSLCFTLENVYCYVFKPVPLFLCIIPFGMLLNIRYYVFPLQKFDAGLLYIFPSSSCLFLPLYLHNHIECFYNNFWHPCVLTLSSVWVFLLIDFSPGCLHGW